MKKMVLIVFLSITLGGCISGRIETEDCKGSFVSLGKSADGAAFNLCGGSADIQKTKNETAVVKALVGLLK